MSKQCFQIHFFINNVTYEANQNKKWSKGDEHFSTPSATSPTTERNILAEALFSTETGNINVSDQ